VFYRTRTRDFERFRTIVTDRGLFLLTVGHFLVLLSHATYAVRFVSITDAVGVCMLISPWLVTRLTPRARLLLSLAAYALTLIVVLYWNPTQHYPLVLKETFFGRIGPGATPASGAASGVVLPPLPGVAANGASAPKVAETTAGLQAGGVAPRAIEPQPPFADKKPMTFPLARPFTSLCTRDMKDATLSSIGAWRNSLAPRRSANTTVSTVGELCSATTIGGASESLRSAIS